MFYVLNFYTHEFRSCDTVDKVVDALSYLQKAGCRSEHIEIVNGFIDDSRFSVDEFLELKDSL